MRLDFKDHGGKERWSTRGSTEGGVTGISYVSVLIPPSTLSLFLILEENERYRDYKILFRRNDKADLLVSGEGVIFMNFTSYFASNACNKDHCSPLSSMSLGTRGVTPCQGAGDRAVGLSLLGLEERELRGCE